LTESKGVAYPDLKPLDLVEQVFGEGGILHTSVPGYTPRPEQMKLVHALALADIRGETLVAEAPCGTGKTFAYLVVALLSSLWGSLGSGSVLITTAGISLQEQLVSKDLPRVLKLLKPYVGEVDVFLQKGINNYLCPAKLKDETRPPLDQLLPADRLRWVYQAMATGKRKGGKWWEGMDLGTAPSVFQPRELEAVSSSSRECLGANCSQYANCPGKSLGRAIGESRRKVVVMNHHLYAALKLYEGTVVERVVVDEAHELPAIIRDFRTATLTEDSYRKEVTALLQRAVALDDRVEQAPSFELLRTAPSPLSYVQTPAPRIVQAELKEGLDSILAALLDLRLLMQLVPGDACAMWRARCDQFRGELATFSDEGHKVVLQEKTGASAGLQLNAIPEATPIKGVDWFVSATIRHARSYRTFLHNAGLPESTRTFTADSPFDWKNQVLACFPEKHMISPKLPRPMYDEKLGKVAVEVVRRTSGRALFACTSWSSVKAVSEAIRGSNSPYQVLVQGEMGKTELIRRFAEDTSSILVGTLSMWTGVDVPGEALSCLVIDKVPFRAMDDPWLFIQQQTNPDWFGMQALPLATNLMAQGFGRLIRSVSDRGACVVLDPRIHPRQHPERKAYASTVLSSVFPPTCSLSFDLDNLSAWLAAGDAQGGEQAAP